MSNQSIVMADRCGHEFYICTRMASMLRGRIQTQRRVQVHAAIRISRKGTLPILGYFFKIVCLVIDHFKLDSTTCQTTRKSLIPMDQSRRNFVSDEKNEFLMILSQLAHSAWHVLFTQNNEF